jgi:predicted nucleic acid-binding Zn ribbon protein
MAHHYHEAMNIRQQVGWFAAIALTATVLTGCVGIDEASQLAKTMSSSAEAAKSVVGELKSSRVMEIEDLKEYRSTLLQMAETQRSLRVAGVRKEIETLYQQARIDIWTDYAKELDNVDKETVTAIAGSRATTTTALMRVKELIERNKLEAEVAQTASQSAVDISRKVEAAQEMVQVASLIAEYNRIEAEALIEIVDGVLTVGSNCRKRLEEARNTHLARLDTRKAQLLAQVASDMGKLNLGPDPTLPTAYDALSQHLDTMKKSSSAFTTYLESNRISNQISTLGNSIFGGVKQESVDIIGNGGKIEKPIALKDLDPAYRALVEEYKSGVEREFKAVSDAKQDIQNQLMSFREQLATVFKDFASDLPEKVKSIINARTFNAATELTKGN